MAGKSKKIEMGCGGLNVQVELFRNMIAGKRVALVGLGVSNLPLVPFLSDLGAVLTCCDRRAEHDFEPDVLQMLQTHASQLHLGERYLDFLDGQEFILKSPGLRPDLPQFVSAVEHGATLTSEMELFLSVCPAPVIGVTGSDGKTTTTTLIYEILKKQGYKCWVGGNIGNPLLHQIEKIDEKDFVVVELSSFQLQTMHVSPTVAVITNLAPNHLDWHRTFDEYIDAKANIFRFQDNNCRLVVNADNSITAKLGKGAPSDVYAFSVKKCVEKGAYLKDDMLYFDGQPVIRRSDILLPGMHNVENYLAAICAVRHAVDDIAIRNVAESFTGVAHRMEFVREFRGVKFYNDSIASSPSRTIAGLKAYHQKVILIAGGYDKKIPYDPLGPVIKEHVKALLLIGATGNLIRRAVEAAYGEEEELLPILQGSDMEYAVRSALTLAREGDIVVLSPASASFDMYKNFEERGNQFKEIVNSL